MPRHSPARRSRLRYAACALGSASPYSGSFSTGIERQGSIFLGTRPSATCSPCEHGSDEGRFFHLLPTGGASPPTIPQAPLVWWDANNSRVVSWYDDAGRNAL